MSGQSPHRRKRPPLTEEWPEGVGRHVLARVGSTNAEALRLAPSLSGPAWVLTHDQTQGRGRRGRGWSMPKGNFAATLVLRPRGGIATAAQLSFVAALALHDTLAQVCGPSARIAIKWPNDVLLNGGKVAGILLESSGDGQGVPAVAVGIGVNLAAAPDQVGLEPTALPAVSVLGESGIAIPADDFLDILAPAFAAWLGQFETFGFAPIRHAWLARATRIGQPIIARIGTSELHGVFEGIDNQGALILVTAGGRQAIPAADIFFQGAS